MYLIYFSMVCYTITIGSCLDVLRGGDDILHMGQLSTEDCTNINGFPNGNNCVCSDYGHTLTSREAEKFYCTNSIQIGCKGYFGSEQDVYFLGKGTEKVKIHEITRHSCMNIKSVHIWNHHGKIGKWEDVTEVSHKNIKLDKGWFSDSLSIEKLDLSIWGGHVIKLTFKCRGECGVLKVRGVAKYPFIREDFIAKFRKKTTSSPTSPKTTKKSTSSPTTPSVVTSPKPTKKTTASPTSSSVGTSPKTTRKTSPTSKTTSSKRFTVTKRPPTSAPQTSSGKIVVFIIITVLTIALIAVIVIGVRYFISYRRRSNQNPVKEVKDDKENVYEPNVVINKAYEHCEAKEREKEKEKEQENEYEKENPLYGTA